MYGLKQIEALKREAIQYGLNVPDGFFNLSVVELQQAANGIGADWMSNLSRAAITAWYGTFAVVAFVHDVFATYYNDGGDAGFYEWNDRYFGQNCVKVWTQKFAWYDPRRYIARYQARHLCFALRKWSRKAWDDAYKKAQAAK